jgi:hypothetical protein
MWILKNTSVTELDTMSCVRKTFAKLNFLEGVKHDDHAHSFSLLTFLPLLTDILYKDIFSVNIFMKLHSIYTFLQS